LKSSHSASDVSSSILSSASIVTRGLIGGSGGAGATGIGGSSGKDPPPLPPKPIQHHRSNGQIFVTASGYGDILEIPDGLFAQQLTKMDCELFKRLIPHQCLGHVWSRRDKTARDKDAATVVATVDQFNAVSFRVISTVLMSCPTDRDNHKSAHHRAKIITKWVDIAQELRVLKNFSSLKAIISGLQSNPVYRLRRAWSYVSREKLQIFEELARIFSGENNALAQRELLVREGTARFADTVGENDHQMQKVLQKHSENSRAISYGTIPYLGTFLTDLTMIDTAIENVTDGLINFDKRRKEFEIIAQIKLLQGAANAYQIEHSEHFSRWFESVLLLDERQAFELSCQIEPQPQNSVGGSSAASAASAAATAASKDNKYKRKAGMSASAGVTSARGTNNHRKQDSIASTASTCSSSHIYNNASTPKDPSQNDEPDAADDSAATGMDASFDTTASSSHNKSASQGVDAGGGGIPRRGSRGSFLSSVSSSCGSCSLDASLASSSNAARSEPLASSTPMRPTVKSVDTSKSAEKPASVPAGNPAAPSSTSSSKSKPSAVTAESPYKTSDFYIIRVSIDPGGEGERPTEGVIMYKSIMVSNHERTGSVIRSAMMKHGLEGSPDNYTLSQLLPDKELMIPAKANVYYAINTQHDLNFILREDKSSLDRDDESTAGAVGGSVGAGTSAGAEAVGATPKGSRKPNSRDTSKARRRLLGLTL